MHKNVFLYATVVLAVNVHYPCLIMIPSKKPFIVCFQHLFLCFRSKHLSMRPITAVMHSSS